MGGCVGVVLFDGRDKGGGGMAVCIGLVYKREMERDVDG